MKSPRIGRCATAVATLALLAAAAPAHAANGEASLRAGEALKAGQRLVSATGKTQLVMQADGNLVLLTPGGMRWNSATNGNPGARVQMQSDGNFVVYSSGGTALWHFGTDKTAAAQLQLTDNEFVALAKDGKRIKTSGPIYGPTRVDSGKTLALGGRLQSPDGRYELVLQQDGNLVFNRRSLGPDFTRSIIWHTGTNGQGVDRLSVQSDGNVVLYSGSQARWHTHSNQSHGSVGGNFQVQVDGNVVRYSSSAQPLWWSQSGKYVIPYGTSTPPVSVLNGEPMPAGWSAANPTAGWACAWSDGCVSYSGFDKRSYWGQSFCTNGHNCTSYVAYRLQRRGAANFVQGCATGSNAASWDERARTCGLTVDATPRAGSVIQWDGGAPMPSGSSYSTAGHVAYVDAVFGDSVLLSESSCSQAQARRTVLSISALRAQGMRAGGPIEVIHP